MASPLMESNTYKDGKIGGGGAKRAWGGLGVALLQGVAAGLDTTGQTAVPDAIPGHTAPVGEKFWVLSATAQKDGINFKLYTDADQNSVRYHANLKVLFPNKKEVPSVDAAMRLVAEVLTLVPQDQGNQSGQPDQAQSSGQPAPFQGKYIDNKNKVDFINFSPNGNFSLFQSGKNYGGTFEVVGDTVIASGPKIRGKVELHIVGDTLTYKDGTTYEKQAEPQDPNTVSSMAPISAPIAPPPPLPDIAPPPPPADVAPPTIALGQTMDQVTANFGQPQKVVKLGVKVIFYYKDMKVTFTDRKVSNVE